MIRKNIIKAVELVAEFNAAIKKLPNYTTVQSRSAREKEFRKNLVNEEAKEYGEAVEISHKAKELADLVYVLAGGVDELHSSIYAQFNSRDLNYILNKENRHALYYSDSLYFCFAEAQRLGLENFMDIFETVHLSNMSKISEGAEFVNGKLQKGANYKKPDLSKYF